MTDYLQTKRMSRFIVCMKCEHKWKHKGQFKHRIRFPKCHSSKNEVNRRIFGIWRPDKVLKKSERRRK